MSNSHIIIHSLEATTQKFLSCYFQYFCELKRIKYYNLGQLEDFVANEGGCLAVRDGFNPDPDEQNELRFSHLVQVRDPRDLLIALHDSNEKHNSSEINGFVLKPENIATVKAQFSHLMEELAQSSFNRSSVSVLRYEDLNWHLKRWVRETLAPFGNRNWYFAVRLHRIFENQLREHFETAPSYSEPNHFPKRLEPNTISQLNAQFEFELRSFYPASLSSQSVA